MPFYKLPAAGPEQQQAPPAVRPRRSAAPANPDRRRKLPRTQYVLGLFRLLLRAVAVRAAASGRLIDEQEERQLRLLRLCSPVSGAGR